MQINKEIQEEKVSQELILVLYFWGFALLRPVLQYYIDYSTIILFIYTFTLMIVSVGILLRTKKRIKHSYIIITGMFFVFLCDLLFRPNDYIAKYMYEFTIYGAIPVYLLSQVKNMKKLLKIFSFLSLIVFLLYFMDPLNGYAVFGDYMTFGFNVALPAYFGLYVGRKFCGYKWMRFFEILCLLDIVVFASKSAIISVIVLWIIIEFFYMKHNTKKNVKILIKILCVAIVFIFLQDIIFWSVFLLGRYGVYSHTLRHIQLYLFNADWSNLFSGRLPIWELAKSMISDNYLIGSGTGAFQARYSFYSHNLYYDIMIQYGLVGLVVFTSLIINSFHKIIRQKDYTQLVGIIFFCLWFPKLFFSIYMFRDIGIWCFLAFGFLHFENIKKSESRIEDKIKVYGKYKGTNIEFAKKNENK